MSSCILNLILFTPKADIPALGVILELFFRYTFFRLGCSMVSALTVVSAIFVDNNNAAVIIGADRVCCNTLIILKLRMDDSSFIGAHGFKSNVLMILYYLLSNTSCKAAESCLSSFAVIFNINSPLDMLGTVGIALAVCRKVAEVLKSF